MDFVKERTNRVTCDGEVTIYTQADIQELKKAGSLAARVLSFIEPYVKPGVTTKKLDTLCHNFIKDNGGNPACLGYNGYPASICSSVNNVVCHGIPNEKLLKNGDIVNIDLVVELDGWHGDTSRTFLVGEVVERARLLVERTQKAMFVGIEQIKPGNHTSAIGASISEFISPFGYGIVRDYGGHGIGLNMHEAPNIIHYKTNRTGIELVPGMCLTVEPMINSGSYKVKLLKDSWTVVTKDKNLSAQFEHTIAVTPTGYEILTLI